MLPGVPTNEAVTFYHISTTYIRTYKLYSLLFNSESQNFLAPHNELAIWGTSLEAFQVS